MSFNTGFFIQQESTAPTQYSMLFDGVNERIIGQTGGVFNFEKTDSFTFALKVKPTSNGSTQSFYTKYINVFPYQGYGLNYLANGSIRFFMICGTPINGQFINIQTTANVLQFGVWNHIVLTYDGTLFSTGVKLYVNDVLIPWATIIADGLNTGGSIISTNNLEIGSASTDGLFYSGLMKDIRIWNTVLTAGNVATEYANMSNYTASPVLIGNLVGWCTMGTDDNAIWGLDNWAFNNLIAGTTNFKAVNMEFIDRTTDIP